jgi:pimeloyl-ACP methyl ester carboxylesterase
VDSYRVRYVSIDPRGNAIVVSALLSIPQGNGGARGLVSYQHGTTTQREQVPSRLNVEGRMVSRLFGGLCYALIASDYQGLGDDTATHPYLVADTVANDVQLALRAIAPLIDGNRATTLVGFSQGGHATLAALRRLEQDPSAILSGAIAIAGPHNLRTISFPAAMSGRSPNDSLYLAYMTQGYAYAFGNTTASVLRSGQVANVHTLLDGAHADEAIIKGLPKDPRELFDDEFLDAFDRSKPNWLLDALKANEVSHWAPRTPLLLLYGDEDVDVPPHEAIATAREMSELGGADVTAKSVGPYDHNGSILKAIPMIIEWLTRHATPD